MSLLPLLFDNGCWAAAPRYPRREAARQGFLEDIFQPLSLVNDLLQSPEVLRELRNLNADFQHTGSSVAFDKNRFQVNFDVQHFKPEEITVKVSENTVTVEAKHEEKQDEHGQIYRHFVRKYKLPKNCDLNRLESKLSSDGVLTINAPTLGENVVHKTIPITQTGKPALSVEEKKVDKEVKIKPSNKEAKPSK